MHLLSLIVLLSLVAVIAIVIDRRLQARVGTTYADPETLRSGLSSMTDRVASAVTSGPRTLYRRIIRRQPAELPQLFRTWFADTSADASLKTWIEGLSAVALEAFTNDVAAFCQRMGFDLSEVVSHQLDANPDLLRTVTQAVLHYCEACRQSAVAQSDLEAYQALQAYEKYPSSRTQQAFGQQLLARLGEAGLTSASMSAYLKADQHTQHLHVMQAIREAVSRNQPAFHRIVKEVIRDRTEPPVEQPASAPSTSNAEGSNASAAPS